MEKRHSTEKEPFSEKRYSIVDLHVHSTRSDGTFTPRELVDYSIQKGLDAFALTDHDTTTGLEEAVRYVKELHSQGQNAPEVIPGIEFSTVYHGKDIHIVGLFIPYHENSFRERLDAFINSRIHRNHKMCKLLQGAGMDITYEKLTVEFPDAVITRAHYAKYMLNHGYIGSIPEAFERYIGDGCPYFVPREKVTPSQAIQLILDVKGVPILAHPLLYQLDDSHLEALVRELKTAGLLGIEAIYSSHTQADERRLRRLADKYRLRISGGSDFHGSNKPGLDLGTGYGRLSIPGEVLENLRRSSHDKLLFTDMDGTLLNDKCEISPAIKDALDQMTRKGHRLILTSGRPLPSILEVRELLGLTYPGMLIISNNGALVYDCDSGTKILEYRLDMEDIRYIIREAEKQNLHIHAYTDTEVVCREMNEELRYYTRRIHLPLKYAADIPSALLQGSYKLQAIHLTDRSRLEAFRDHLAPYLGSRIQFVFSNDQYLEILPAAAGKGNAMAFVRDYLYIPAYHTYAAGDGENDISMLEAAHISIAMKNAPAFVQEKADIITAADNNHDGLLDVIQKIFSK